MRAIIFDFDGTLYSSENPLKDLIDQRTNEFLHNHGIEDIVSLEQRIPNVLEALDYFSLDRKEYNNFVYDELKYDNYLKEDCILNKLLMQVSCPKSVVSLSPKKHLMAAMEHLNILSFFNEVISICDIPQLVSKKNIYSSILEKNDRDAKNIVCIGDSYEIDLFPARQLGMTVFLCSNRTRGDNSIKSFNNIKSCLTSLLSKTNCAIFIPSNNHADSDMVDENGTSF